MAYKKVYRGRGVRRDQNVCRRQDKALGPNGYTMSFFQTFLDSVKGGLNVDLSQLPHSLEI